MFPAAPAAPFARNVACRGVLVIYFSDFQDPSRFVTFSYVVLPHRISGNFELGTQSLNSAQFYDQLRLVSHLN